MKEWDRTDLLSLQELSRAEIELILKTAASFKEVSTRSVKKVPTLRGKTIVLSFFEPSTRTRSSFELAAKRLSADTLTMTSSTSAIAKGETYKDTFKTIEAMQVDAIVIRHGSSGIAQQLAAYVAPAIINAGDGCHEHPTQGLLDLFTIQERKKSFDGLKVSIIGDIAHSRVARSNIWGLNKLGAAVTVCGPRPLLPRDIDRMGVEVTTDLAAALKDADVVNVLRIQRERQQAGLFPSLREYAMLYGISREKLEKYARPDIVVMHPGPMNPGIEITPDVAEGPFSVIFDQVTNGIAVRMAVLYLVMQANEADVPQE
ncbi:MAG: aspartate carbamoyltransferase catalytic subunit [Candidatus Omnitrophica bacterium]|nr:aspartate carbamoyltransferase catalytic subunit [Candidatus Omnitrophota bacterium]